MKEVVKLSQSAKKITSTETAAAVIYHTLAAVIAFIASRAVVLNDFVPFGLSILAGSPLVFSPAAATGAFIGYFFPAIESGTFKYIAALFALLAIKFLLGNYKKLITNPAFLSLICFLSSGLTCLAVTTENIIISFSEALLAALGCYFTARLSKSVESTSPALNTEELASLLTLFSILFIGLSDIEIGGISISRLLSVLLILTASKFGGVLSGAISGIAVSFTFLLSGSSLPVTVTYAFGGMISGLFSIYGRYTQIAAFILTSFLGIACGGINLDSVSLLIEIIIGSAAFLLLPRNINVGLGKIFSAQPKLTTPTSLKKTLSMRLNMASKALSDVSETVEQVSIELGKINAPDWATVINRIEQEACMGCKLRLYCWESKKDDTVSAVLDMTKAVKSGELSPELSAPESFRGRCLRVGRMGASVYKNYSEFASKTAAENRLSEIRSVVTDQFDGISKMLIDLSDDFNRNEKFDNATALQAATALKNIDIRTEECSCRVDKFGRMTVEFRTKKTPEQRINKMQIMKLLSITCERDFDAPVISEAGGDLYITLSERAMYKVDFGVKQLSASDNNMCGDAYNCFLDGRGHFIIILSDGMGTGGRAAVDGTMASGLMMRLLKAGFGYDCALKILNSSMLFKSTDESLATLDIVSIDLFTGMAELYKAGAAPSLLRRSGRTGKAESSSLPAGILRDIGFDYAQVKIKTGDIILLMSDGALSGGIDWIRSELENWQDGKAEDLAELICESARRRNAEKRSDDITVIAAIVEKRF